MSISKNKVISSIALSGLLFTLAACDSGGLSGVEQEIVSVDTTARVDDPNADSDELKLDAAIGLEVLWSETYGDAGANAIVHIPADQRVYIDRNINVAGLIVEGQMFAQDTRNLTVTTEWVLVANGGVFRVGSAGNPFEHNFTLNLTGDNPLRDIDLRDQIGMQITNNDGFLMAMGDDSRIRLFGADAQKRSWTQITSTAEAGERTLNLADATGWEVGDKIAIASSTRFIDEAEELTITNVSNNGRRITVAEPLQFRHYGEIETYGNGTREWNIDMRAEVGLLSRNVTVTGNDDAAVERIGGHIMAGNNASIRLSGVELTRMGQYGHLGRYPIHWHMLDDATDQYVENSSIHHTFNKGMTVHGTHNLRIQNNVVFDHIGHGVFLEDGNETGHQIQGNLVFSTRRAPETPAPSVVSDRRNVASFWIEHPNNRLIGNHAAGSDHTAIFIFGDDAPHGESTGMNPPGGFSGLVVEDNTVHSSGQGLFIDGQVDRRTLLVDRGFTNPVNSRVPFLVKDTTAYKIHRFNKGAVWIRSRSGSADNVMAADNDEGAFLGGNSSILNSVFVAESRGNSEEWQREERQRGVRMYVSGVSAISNTHFVGFDQNADNEYFGNLEAAFGMRQNRFARFAYIRGLTFEDTPPEGRFEWVGQDNNPAKSPEGSIFSRTGSRLLDMDGSLTGVPYSVLRPYNTGRADSVRMPILESWMYTVAPRTWEAAMDDLFAPGAAPIDNHLFNGSFNSGTADWASCGGRHSISAVGTHSSNAMVASAGGCVYQEFLVERGKEYELNCQASATNTATLTLTFTDDDSVPLATNEASVTSSALSTVTVSGTAPGSAIFGVATLSAEDTAVFDDCIVVEI